MGSEDKVIVLYCTVDDRLRAMRYTEDMRVKVEDSEVISTAFVSASVLLRAIRKMLFIIA